MTGIHARTAVNIHKRTSFPGLEELFTVANVAIDYLVGLNQSSNDISDVTIALLALENVDFYILYAILTTFRRNVIRPWWPSEILWV